MKNSKRRKALKRRNSVDMISNLPDPILHLILSCLPSTEEVIRTSILSTRWRHLWASVPSIDIDYSRSRELKRKAPQNFRKKFKEFVNWVLVNKPFNLYSCRLSCGDHYNMSTVGRWIDTAVRRNVKLLDLNFGTADMSDEIELPRCLVTCGSLEVLRLSLCEYNLRLPKLTGFSALRVLELKGCWLLDDNLVKDFFKSCPLLEDLSLVDCDTYDLYIFCISCPKLKNLRIGYGNKYDPECWELGNVEDVCDRLQICCPKLVYLELAGYIADALIFESLDSLKKAVIYVPQHFDVRELLSRIYHVESLSLHIYFPMKNKRLGDLPKSLPNLKTLELTTRIDVFNMNVLIQILICSPNMESLHLVIKEGLSYYSSSPPKVPAVDFPSGHIFERLKMVKMIDMTGVLHKMGFIKFLLGSSPVLETMSINPSMNNTDEKLSFSIELLRFRRASPEAEIIIY